MLWLNKSKYLPVKTAKMILNRIKNDMTFMRFFAGLGLIAALIGCDGPQSIVLPDNPPAEQTPLNETKPPIWAEKSNKTDSSEPRSDEQSSLAPPEGVSGARPYDEPIIDNDIKGSEVNDKPLPLKSLMIKAEVLSQTHYGDYPLWSSNRRFKAHENARYHYTKHGPDLGVKSYEDFIALSHGYIQKPPKGTKTLMRYNGDKLLYNEELNLFAVATKKGAPRTIFRPYNGAAYWDKQKQIEAGRRTIRND
jgi:hypothetical protein